MMIEIEEKFVKKLDLDKQKLLFKKYHSLKGKYMLFLNKGGIMGSKISIKKIRDICIKENKAWIYLDDVDKNITKHKLSFGNLGMIWQLKIETLNFGRFKYLVFNDIIKLNQYLDSEQTLLNL